MFIGRNVEDDPFEDYHREYSSVCTTADEYRSTLDYIFLHHPEIRECFSKLNDVVDLGAGRGGSVKIIAKFCPNAFITAVDDVTPLFEETIRDVGAGRIAQVISSARNFLRISQKEFDGIFMFRSHPDLLKYDDIPLLATKLKKGGLFVRIAPEGTRPYPFERLFEPVYVTEDRFSPREIWKKK